MALDPDGTVILVELDIIEAGGIVEPHAPPDVCRHLVRQVGAVLEVSNADREVFRAFDVGAPGYQAMVGRMIRSAEIEEGLAFGLLVAVEHDGLRSAVPGLPADERVLAALTVAGEIGEGPVGLGNGGIVLLDAPAHLRDEAGLKLFRSGEGCFRIGILLLEAGADLGIENRRILENLPPVLRLQPCVIILDPDAMNIEDIGFGGSRGGSRQQMKRRSLKIHERVRLDRRGGAIMHS